VLCCQNVICICSNVMIIFFCKHASLPLIFTEEMLTFWKGKLVGGLEKRELRSLQKVGFKLGPLFYAKQDTALNINNIIVTNTISLLLVSK